MDVLPTLEKVDAIITDPPFGVGNFIQIKGNIRGKKDLKGIKVDWNNKTPENYFFELIKEKSKHRIIWGANYFNCFEENGGAIVWDKCQPMPNFSKVDIASCTHFKKTEIIKIPWTNFDSAKKSVTNHPCERPVELYEFCINYLPKINSILDPFLGSGSCAIASIKLGRKFIGIEREEQYFNIAVERIKQAYAQGNLFEEPKKQPEQVSLL